MRSPFRYIIFSHLYYYGSLGVTNLLVFESNYRAQLFSITQIFLGLLLKLLDCKIRGIWLGRQKIFEFKRVFFCVICFFGVHTFSLLWFAGAPFIVVVPSNLLVFIFGGLLFKYVRYCER